MTPSALDRPLPDRVALVSYVDRNYLRGFEVLVKSLLHHNPWVDVEYIVLYDDLEPLEVERIAVLYPRVTFQRIDPSAYERYAKGDQHNYLVEKAYYILEAFRLRGYDRVVTLDVDMVVLGDISHLFTTDADFAAVPQHFDSDGGRRINSGVMTFSSAYMCDEFETRIDEVGVSGEYELDRHDQGILSAALAGNFTRLEKKYNLVKRAVRPGATVPADTRILHYTGRFKPWNGGERGYESLERLWWDADVNPIAVWRACASHEGADSVVKAEWEAMASPFAALSDMDLLDLRSAEARYRLEGDYLRGFLSMRAGVLAGEEPKPGALRDYGRAALAVSRPDIARVALSHATVDPVVAPSALALLSEVEWTYRNYDAASDAALESIRRHPTFGRAHQLLKRVHWSRQVDRHVPDGAGLRVGHVALYVDEGGNFGDVMLPLAVRESLDHALASARWSSIHAHQVFDVEQARWANTNLDALVVGGGGLFLPDTAPNANSGWQWNVTDEALKALEIPLVVYTVGYNIFPGQAIHGSRFSESIRLLVERAAFVGMRNHGSVDAVRSLVGEELGNRVEFLPCVTTVYGEPPDPDSRSSSGDRPVVALNVAFDRKALRFGDAYGDFVGAVATLARSLTEVAELRCLAHTAEDEAIVHDLHRSHGISLPIDSLYAMPYEDALDAVRRAAVVVGMRGHAGMIPFGLGVPILSIISHAKLRYFLDDIGHAEWGFDVDDPLLAERLDTAIRKILDDPLAARREILAARAQLDEVVSAANAKIARVLGPSDS